MKKLYTTLLCAFALISTTTNAQVPLLTSCNPPAELLERYDDDIRTIAIQYAWQTNHPDSNQIEVSPGLYDFVADGFGAIYNSNLPAADSGLNKYCVRAEYPAIKEFYIFFNFTHAWTQAWQNGQTVTGHPVIDSLFSTHDMVVDHYAYEFGEAYVIVKSARVLNLTALNNALVQVAGINHLEPMGNFFPGGMSPGGIIFSAENNVRNYTFYMNFYNSDTLYTGWTGTYFWKFQVDANCNASDLGSVVGFDEGEVFPLPEPQNCNLFLSAAEPVSEPLIKLFPNPTSGTVHIQTEALLSGVKLYNTTGSCVLTQPSGAELDLSHLPTGLYYFSGTDAQGNVHTQRLVKN